MNTSQTPGPEDQGNTFYVILISCIATIGGFLFGFDSGVINGTVDGLQTAFDSDSVGTGFNVASMLLGFEAWRWMFWVEIVPATSFFLALILIPESPRYLVLIRRHELALEVLATLSGRTEVFAGSFGWVWGSRPCSSLLELTSCSTTARYFGSPWVSPRAMRWRSNCLVAG